MAEEWMQTLLAATDGSEGANRAIDAAAKLAKAAGAKLVILTIGGNISGDEIKNLARSEQDVGEALELISNQILQQAKERARRIGAPTIVLQSAWGDPAEAIIEAARREHADAIVVGRRGRGRLAGLLLGSVSGKLVNLAPCTVIVVP
jgi:nucleotide-binding universal stress UspA family protein